MNNKNALLSLSLSVTLSFILIFIFFARITQAAEFHLSNDYLITTNETSGRGKDSSYFTTGFSYLDTFGFSGMGGQNKRLSYNYSAGLNFTGDEMNDIKKVSLVNAMLELKTVNHSLSMGDIYQSYSRYTFDTALKGVTYSFLKKGTLLPQISGIFGWDYPRWDSLWNDPLTKTLKREGFAIRIKQPLSDNLWVGYTQAKTKDTDSVDEYDQLYDSINHSFDFSFMPVSGIILTGERAKSKYVETVFDDSGKGGAYRLDLAVTQDLSRISIEYENVHPEFSSFFGSAAQDRRKIKTRWSYASSEKTDLDFMLLYYRDNLNGDNEYGTMRNWSPEITLSMETPFEKRENSSAEITYHFDRQYDNDSSTADHYITANYQDVFFSVESNTDIAWTIYRTEDAISRSNELTFNTSLNSETEFSSLIMKPSVNIGAWKTRDKLSFTTDKNYEYAAGLEMEAPSLKLITSLKAGENRMFREGSDDSEKFFAVLSGTWRPGFLDRNIQSYIYFSAKFNQFSYTDDSENFREKSLNAGIRTAF